MTDEVIKERAQTFVDQGQAAARAGQRELARRYLQAAVDIDPDNATAWLWLAGVQDDPYKVKYSLKQVLEIEPNNKRARQGLAMIEEQLAEAGPEVEREQPEPEPDQPIEQALRAQLRQSSEAADTGERGRRPQLAAEPAGDPESAGASFSDFFSGEDIIYRAITLALLGLLIIGIIVLTLLLLGIIAPIA